MNWIWSFISRYMKCLSSINSTMRKYQPRNRQEKALTRPGGPRRNLRPERNIPDLTVFMDMSTEKVNNWGSLFLRKILDTDASG